MNKFIKLMINTLYGDFVSPYFICGNTIVGIILQQEQDLWHGTWKKA